MQLFHAFTFEPHCNKSNLTNRSYFPALTGLRYIAALFVFIHHLTPLWLPVPLYNFFQEFHVGVPVFFVLSGFLICYRYYDNVQLNRVWFKNYMINRFARIYPLYFLVTVVAIYFFKEGWMAFFMNITFLRGFFGDFIFTGVHQGWSLTVEECFYLLAPFIFVLSTRIKLMFQALLIFLTGIILATYVTPNSWHEFMPNYMSVLSYTFFGRCFEFFAGIQLALWYKNDSSLLRVKFNKTYAGITGILFIVLVLADIKGGHRWGIHRYSGIFLNNIVLPIFVCSLIAGLLTEDTYVKRFLEQKKMVVLGKSSYAFYLIHYGIWHLFVKTFITQNFFMELILSTSLSVVVFHWIEEPANKFFRKFKSKSHFPGYLPVVIQDKKSTSGNQQQPVSNHILVKSNSHETK